MTTPSPPRTRPYFIPAGLEYEQLPEELRIAVQEIIEPAYRQLVVEAVDPLERAAGVTFVHGLFLELLDQHDLGQQVADRVQRRLQSALPQMDDLDRHFRLTISKQRAGDFLLRIRTLRLKYGIPVLLRRGVEEAEIGNSQNC